jgi:prolyl-tRNA synthetase
VKLKTVEPSSVYERPAEATLDSHAFLLRGAYARQVANGIYSLLLPGLRVVKNIEQIIREEMNRVGGQEVLMPVVLPRELWEESGRYQGVGAELVRFKDRTGHDMLLAMTHEEGVVHLSRYEAGSYKQYPFMLYQFQTKFRDEPRSRGGLIRVREFTMKDAYSFHTSPEDLDQYYRKCDQAYRRIFARAGLPEVAVVQSDSGMMGGKIAHEYMLLTPSGEDSIIACGQCGFIANAEVAAGKITAFAEAARALEKVHTPGKKTISEVSALLQVPARQTAKAVFYEKDGDGMPVLALIRGDREINEAKLAKIMRAAPVAATEKTILGTGAVPGFASPMGLRNCRVIVDPTVRESANLVCGANETDYHFKNFNLDRDAPGLETADLAQIQEGDACFQCGARLELKRGIEVGNIFQLGKRYTESMKMEYIAHDGGRQAPIMGCYGIGVGRLMSSIMEAKHDDYGPLWPVTVAPWTVHLTAIGIAEGNIRELAEKAYADFRNADIDVLFDDREERPGVQFAEADLLGAPLRFVISAKNIAKGEVEWKSRLTGEKGYFPMAEMLPFAQKWLANERDKVNTVADAIKVE